MGVVIKLIKSTGHLGHGSEMDAYIEWLLNWQTIDHERFASWTFHNADLWKVETLVAVTDIKNSDYSHLYVNTITHCSHQQK